MIDIVKTIEELHSVNNRDEMIKDLTKLMSTGDPHKTQITIVERILKNADGSEMFEYIGSNATTMAGTQTIVENLYANLDTSNTSTMISNFPVLEDSVFTAPADNATTETPAAWVINKGTKFLETRENKFRRPDVPRKIFGFMIGDDGAVGSTVKVVNRRSQSFDPSHIVPFLRQRINSDAPTQRMHLGTGSATKDTHETDPGLLTTIRESILSEGKYAARVAIGEDESAYLVKLLKFNVDNITVAGGVISTATLTTNTQDLSLDVRTRVQMKLHMRKDELSVSYASAAKNNNSKGVRGAMISSFMLVAGRPDIVSTPEGDVSSYSDIIVTNRINFTELPVDETELNFRYTIYYV